MMRSTLAVLTLALLVLLLNGCKSFQPASKPSARVTSELTPVKASAEGGAGGLAAPENRIESKEPMLVVIRYTGNSGDKLAYLLFSPWPTGGSNTFVFKVTYNNNLPHFELVSGAVYVSEEVTLPAAAAATAQAAAVPWVRPRVKATRVTAVGTSTKYIVQIDGAIDRVCCVSGTLHMSAESNNANVFLDLTANETYAEGYDGSVGVTLVNRGAVPTVRPDPVRSMYEYMVSLATSFAVP